MATAAQQAVIAPGQAPTVDAQTIEVNWMAQFWGLAEALIGGTPAMRAAGKLLLPQFTKEEDKAYERRLSTATLYPAFKRTLNVMVGKPFQKEVTLSADTPDQIKGWAQDIDLQGNTLHNFCVSLFEKTMAFGLEGVLVDYPKIAAPANGQPVTQAMEQAIGARPYLVWIKHGRILGWQLENVNGAVKLAQLRLMDSRNAPNGPWASVQVPQVRVLYPGRYEVYEKDAQGKFTVLAEYGTTPNMDEIPFVPFYGSYLGYMMGVSPLRDLMYLNVKHWQSQSDQDTILHVARVPILAVFGADTNTKLVVGASSAVEIPIGGDMKFVEHSGQAIGAGENSLYMLEHQMVQTGAELLLMKPGQRTATEANNDAEGNRCDLQRMVEMFEASLDKCLALMAKWAKLPSSGAANLFKDFGAANLSDASAQVIVAMGQAGFITRETVLKEQQRRGVLSSDVDVSAEAQAAKDQGPPLGSLTNRPPPTPLPTASPAPR